MTRLIRLALALVLMLAAIPSSVSAQGKAAASPVAHFDLDSILDVMPEFKKASDEAAVYYKELENQLIVMQGELDRKLAEYDSLNKTWTGLIKSLREKEINDLQQNIQAFQMNAQNAFSAKRAELLQPIYDKIKAAVKAVALRKGYKYVIDSSKSSSVVMYASPADDIFMDLVKELGITLPAKPATPPPSPGK